MSRGALRLEKRSDGVAVMWIDDPEDALNTLKSELAEALDALLQELESDRSSRALVFISGKEDNFIVGANLDMLRAVATAEQGAALSRMSQRLQARLAGLAMPTIAAIHGTCLGGGLELALAFDARIASDDDTTRFGLPEVQLGLLPGGGGTQRLPRLIGLPAALDLLLTGRRLRAERALALGLVDELVAKARLLERAIELASAVAAGSKTVARPLRSLFTKQGFSNFLAARNPLGRRIVFEQARARALAKTRGNYPAPERILEVTRLGLERGMDEGLVREATVFGELLMSAEARELINIFFASNELKKDTGIDDPSVVARDIQRIAVLGAGLMGAGIAYVSSYVAHRDVVLKDRDQDAVARGIAHIDELLRRRVTRGALSESEREAVRNRVRGVVDYDLFADVDVVIEAVFEDRDLKRQMIRDVEGLRTADVIFASNTSSIPIAQLAEASERPGNVIGMHYFSPVESMPLLEIVITDQTSPATTATCVALGKQQQKTVIVVRDGPGFYTSRILAPYMNEAAWLLAEGVSVEAIDDALLEFGFPVGPLTLLDEVGIDVAAKVGSVLAGAFGERMQPPPIMAKLAADERKGKKNARGFYRYDGAGKSTAKRVDETVYDVLGVTPGDRVPPTDIAERCVLQMVNEAALCLEQGIIRGARDGDIGAVFGLGFPPFLGGPFRYLDACGIADVRARLEVLANRHGKRFEVAPLIVEMASSSRRFYV